jgi:hypothetical protein
MTLSLEPDMCIYVCALVLGTGRCIYVCALVQVQVCLLKTASLIREYCGNVCDG